MLSCGSLRSPHTVALQCTRQHVNDPDGPFRLVDRRPRNHPERMSRRRRNKPHATRADPGAAAGRRERTDHGARVTVDENTWEAFKASVAPGSSIGQVLGDLVTRHVSRFDARRAQAGTIDDQDLLGALERAEELQRNVAYLLVRIEDRLRGPDRQPSASPSPAPPASLPLQGR